MGLYIQNCSLCGVYKLKHDIRVLNYHTVINVHILHERRHMCVYKYTNCAATQQGEHIWIDVLRHFEPFRVMTNSQGKKKKRSCLMFPKNKPRAANMFAPVSTKTIRLRRGWPGPSRTLADPQLIGYISRNLVAGSGRSRFTGIDQAFTG